MSFETTETTADRTATADNLPLAPGRWALDPLHSAVNFTIRHLGISKVRGRFAEFDAELVVGETLAESAVNATIALASIDTGNPDRDAHVRASDLLDVERRPTMVFRSTRITGSGEDWTLEGDLTIGDVRRPVSLAVEFGGVGAFGESRHAGFEATGEIKRSEFGLTFAPGLLGEAVKIQLDMQFEEPGAGGGQEGA
ncbi:YceI family protein [Streptomyces sp. G45]|uniref:YceI family protein n=1 Tax=Streptomyces sp. G45 TaxID=3406627 RepID=UPI003C1611F5